MPIVDGMDSTEMIRKFESTSHDYELSDKVKRFGRVPIFAVSASLVERDVQKYIDIGFDSERQALTYTPGNWEHGGWFDRSKIEVEVAS